MRLVPRLTPTIWKFGVFALVCLVLLVGLAAKIGNLSLFADRHPLYAQMSDVTGLASGDTVDIAGVPVGQVSGIAVQHGHALVTLSLDNDVVLHAGTDVGMRWQNVIGQKDVYLYPDQRGPVLGPGATLPLSHDVSDASVDAFLNSIGPFLSAINPAQANQFVENVSGALEGDTAQIDQLIDNGATVSATVGALDTQVGSVIGNLDQVLTAMAQRSGDVGTLVDNLQTVAGALSSHNTVLDQVVGNLSLVASDLAQLVGNNRSSLDTTVNDLDTVAEDIQAHQQDLARSLSTLGAGLAPYQEISSYGQWFQVQTVYSCLANQTSCSYYQSDAPPAGSGPGGGAPLPGPLSSLPTGLPSAGAASAGPTPGLPQMLAVVGGAPAAPSASTVGGGL